MNEAGQPPVASADGRSAHGPEEIAGSQQFRRWFLLSSGIVCVALVGCGIIAGHAHLAQWPLKTVTEAINEAAAGKRPVVIASRQREGMFLLFQWIARITPPPTVVGNASRAWLEEFEASGRAVGLKESCRVLGDGFIDAAKSTNDVPGTLDSLALRLSEPPRLELLNRLTVDDVLKKQADRHSNAARKMLWSDYETQQYAPVLQRFYRQAGVEEFLRAQAPEYVRAVRAWEQTLGKIDVAAEVRQYLGLGETPPFVVVVSGLAWPSGSWLYRAAGEGQQVAVILCALPAEGGFWEKGGPAVDWVTELDDLGLIAHELVHPYLELYDLESVYEDEFDRLASLWAAMARRLPPSWHDQWWNSQFAWEEEITGAIALRLLPEFAAAMYPPDEAAKVERAVEQRLEGLAAAGYPCTLALYNRLREYERLRSRYPDLASFFPELLRAMEAALKAAADQ